MLRFSVLALCCAGGLSNAQDRDDYGECLNALVALMDAFETAEVLTNELKLEAQEKLADKPDPLMADIIDGAAAVAIAHRRTVGALDSACRRIRAETGAD